MTGDQAGAWYARYGREISEELQKSELKRGCVIVAARSGGVFQAWAGCISSYSSSTLLLLFLCLYSRACFELVL